MGRKISFIVAVILAVVSIAAVRRNRLEIEN